MEGEARFVIDVSQLDVAVRPQPWTLYDQTGIEGLPQIVDLEPDLVLLEATGHCPWWPPWPCLGGDVDTPSLRNARNGSLDAGAR